MQNKLLLLVFELSFLNHVVFCLIFLDLFRNMFPLQKMCSLPLYFLLSFILFPSVPSFLSPLVFFVSFTFSPFYFKLLFVVFYYLHVSLCKTLCQKKCIFLDCSKTPFLCLLFSLKKNSVFSVSFFVDPFLH